MKKKTKYNINSLTLSLAWMHFKKYFPLSFEAEARFTEELMKKV